MTKPFVESSFCQKDIPDEVPLRPKTLDDFVGQDHIRDQLNVLVSAAKQRNDVLTHCLFCGPPGLGKTTLSQILANSMGVGITITSGAVIEKAGDLAGILTNLKEGDILFIDEMHRLSKTIEEYLYPAMEDFCLDLVIDSGSLARSVQVKINKFTLVGATTRLGLLSSPLRTRFGFTCRLDYYPPDILQKILKRSSDLLKVKINQRGLLEIAKRSRGTPRIANNLLKWVRDFAQIQTQGEVDDSIVQKALQMLSIDALGLDEMDKRILHTIVEDHRGGPVGLQTIAVAVGEEALTIEEVYEPFLIMLGMLKRTPRGREATPYAYEHLGKPIPKKFSSEE